MGVTDLVAAGAVSLADAGRMFPAVSVDEVTTDVTNLTDGVLVNMIGVQTCVVWVIGYRP